MSRIKRPFLATLIAGTLFMLSLAPVAQADSMGANQPSEMAVMGDILIARPFLVTMTGLGMGLYAVTLPFSVLGNNEDEMAEMMVRRPAHAAFLRCLGCTPDQDQSRRISRQVDDANKNK